MLRKKWKKSIKDDVLTINIIGSMLLTNMEHFLYILNYVIKHGFLIEILADYRKVRTFVLCFSAVLLFLCPYVSY